MQVPAAKPATVLPDTVQILGVPLLKLTSRPEVAVALILALPPTSRLGAAPKRIVWLALELMVTLCAACGAGS